jgi:hypothetical protein
MYTLFVQKVCMEFDRNPLKNNKLLEQRGISFEEVLMAIQEWKIYYNGPHPNQKNYPHQHVLLVKVREYMYVVPYVITLDQKYFLKTIYPSRKFKNLL